MEQELEWQLLEVSVVAVQAEKLNFDLSMAVGCPHHRQLRLCPTDYHTPSSLQCLDNFTCCYSSSQVWIIVILNESSLQLVTSYV